MICNKGLILFVALILASEQAAVSASGFDVYGKVERFSWTEYEAGSKILEETGPIFTVGLIQRTTNPNRSFSQTNLAYFGGAVAYDGATWSGVPISSDTNYSGIRGEYVFYSPVPEISGGYAFLGVGYSQWNRDLISTQSSQGYLEKWKSTYTKLGYRQETARSRFELGIKYPFRNENSIDQFGSSTRPGRQTAVFCEANWAISQEIEVGLTYDAMRFSPSEPVYAKRLGVSVYQPESKSDSWGLRLKAKF